MVDPGGDPGNRVICAGLDGAQVQAPGQVPALGPLAVRSRRSGTGSGVGGRNAARPAHHEATFVLDGTVLTAIAHAFARRALAAE